MTAIEFIFSGELYWFCFCPFRLRFVCSWFMPVALSLDITMRLHCITILNFRPFNPHEDNSHRRCQLRRLRRRRLLRLDSIFNIFNNINTNICRIISLHHKHTVHNRLVFLPGHVQEISYINNSSNNSSNNSPSIEYQARDYHRVNTGNGSKDEDDFMPSTREFVKQVYKLVPVSFFSLLFSLHIDFVFLLIGFPLCV